MTPKKAKPLQLDIAKASKSSQPSYRKTDMSDFNSLTPSAATVDSSTPVKTSAITTFAPELTNNNGQITTTSLQIAQHFGKVHRDVVRAIENIDCSAEFRLRNFAQSSFESPMPNGGTRKHPMYHITKDGFVFLAMGFTGKEAAQWKEAYITAFNKMEEALSKKVATLPAQTPYAVLPGQTLSAEQADALRALLTENVKRLPKSVQATAMIQGWSKLKAHFHTDYRHIPASEFTEALSIVTRHVVEWNLVDEGHAAGTLEETIERLTAQVSKPNSFPVEIFMPLVNATLERLGITRLLMMPSVQAKDVHAFVNDMVPMDLLPKVIDSANLRLGRYLAQVRGKEVTTH